MNLLCIFCELQDICHPFFPKHVQFKLQRGLSVLLCPRFCHFSLLPLLSPAQCIIAVWLASTSTLGSFKKPRSLSPSASRHWAGLWKVLRVLASGAQIHACVYRILTNSFLLPCFLGLRCRLRALYLIPRSWCRQRLGQPCGPALRYAARLYFHMAEACVRAPVTLRLIEF